jgi:hypothetical protein
MNEIQSIKSYSRKLLRSRYSLLYSENSLFIQQNKFSCFRDKPDKHEKIMKRCMIIIIMIIIIINTIIIYFYYYYSLHFNYCI